MGCNTRATMAVLVAVGTGVLVLPVGAFTSPSPHAIHKKPAPRSQLSMASSPPPPLRGAGALFGSLFDFNLTAVADAFLEADADAGDKEWPVKRRPSSGNFTKDDDNESEAAPRVTILNKNGKDANEDVGDANNDHDENNNDQGSSGWDDVPLAEIGQGELPVLEMDEGEMEDLASLLMERPPTLRQLRGPKIAAANGAEGRAGSGPKIETVSDAVDTKSGGADAAGDVDAAVDFDSNAVGQSRRARIEAQAAPEKGGEEGGDEEVRPNFEAYVRTYSRGVPPKAPHYNSNLIGAAPAPSGETLAREETSGETPSTEDVIDRSVLPFKERREGIPFPVAVNMTQEAAGREEGLAAPRAEGEGGGPSPAAKEGAAAISSNRPLAPTHTIEEDYRKIRGNVSIESEGDGEVDEEAGSNVRTEKKKQKEDSSESDFMGALQSFLPAPPLVPPTQRQIDNNSLATNANLSNINQQLQGTLANQRQSLGKLRRRVNELEQELLRARRIKRESIDEEVNAATSKLRERYERQLAEAREAISKLEEQESALGRQLEEERSTLERTLEAKEQVAAEYGYAVKSYEDLKGAADSQTSNWATRVDESQRQVASLEAKLEEATAGLQKYQEESRSWRNECADKANKLEAFASQVQRMQGTIDSLQSNIVATQQNITDVKLAAREEEDARSKRNLQTLSDEYERLLREKSKKIGALRRALRTARNEKRRVERNSEKGKREALRGLREEMEGQIDGLRGKLVERDSEIERMEAAVEEAERVTEERERLMAEIMFLTKSFEELRAELASNAEMYEDCIQSYESEAAAKDARIRELETELNVANEKVLRLESQVEKLTTELERERAVSANLTATVSELQTELELARTNANGYDDVVAILRKEAEAYRSQLSQARDDAATYKRKKLELEQLVEKAKDSLIEETERLHEALDEKDTQIAKLDRDLAEKMNEIHMSGEAVAATKSELTTMTNNYKIEKERADALDDKIKRLNQLAASATSADASGEIDRLTGLLEEVAASNEEYKALVETYQSKTKLLSHQLLLSGQNASRKQSRIDGLREELSEAAARAEATAGDRDSTSDEVAQLRDKLDDVQSKSTVWKAQANGMIVELTSKLKEKDESAAELQSKLDELSEERERYKKSSNEALEEEIARLKSAMEDAQQQAKEKMRHKNRTLKEMEDTVSSLTAATEDLKREKDKIAARLEEELQRRGEDFAARDRRASEAEDRLAKEHLVAMAEMEGEMNETVQKLQEEVRMLKEEATAAADEVAGGKVPKQGFNASSAAVASTRKVREMEDALRRSKEKEVLLIQSNMRMQHKLQDLELQREELRSLAGSGEADEEDEVGEEGGPVELPTYYKERQRPAVVRFVGKTVGSAWRGIVRRTKKLL